MSRVIDLPDGQKFLMADEVLRVEEFVAVLASGDVVGRDHDHRPAMHMAATVYDDKTGEKREVCLVLQLTGLMDLESWIHEVRHFVFDDPEMVARIDAIYEAWDAEQLGKWGVR